MTPAESRLWDFLKSKQLEGRKFRRQTSIDFFIVDFYCFSEKLAIELDGKHHEIEEIKKQDEERTKILNAYGIKVIRFKNEEVFEEIAKVLETIKSCFNS